MKEPTEDQTVFGKDVWVYCAQHRRPHLTGWCTVSIKDKIPLLTNDEQQAYNECRLRGLKLYQE